MTSSSSIQAQPHEREVYEQLAQRLEAAQQLQVSGSAQTEPLTLTPTLVALLRQAASELAAGHALTLLSTGEDLSTHEAAKLLGVSRPFLIARLLDTAKLPHHLVGSHRRIALADLLAYQQEQARRRAIADELTAESQEMGLY
jgi:excisionase family DNA binding protein